MNINNKIEEAIKAIDKTTVLFYQNKNNEGYKQLEDTLDVISSTINEIMVYKQQDEEKNNSEINNLNVVLMDAMKALENRDTLLFSDIIQYDLKELLKKFEFTQ